MVPLLPPRRRRPLGIPLRPPLLRPPPAVRRGGSVVDDGGGGGLVLVLVDVDEEVRAEEGAVS